MEPITQEFSREFEDLSSGWRAVADTLFDAAGEINRTGGNSAQSAILLVRSAAKVEQAFAGLNAQLWDDPLEWTLPEMMGTKEKVLAYFEEVDAARQGGFGRIRSDGDLSREIWTPAGTMPLVRLILRTAVSARSLADDARRLSVSPGQMT